METQGKQYKWKIVAWSALRYSDKIQCTLQKSQWFDQKKYCIADLKEKMKNDVADSWGLKNTYLNVGLCLKILE